MLQVIENNPALDESTRRIIENNQTHRIDDCDMEILDSDNMSAGDIASQSVEQSARDEEWEDIDEERRELLKSFEAVTGSRCVTIYYPIQNFP